MPNDPDDSVQSWEEQADDTVFEGLFGDLSDVADADLSEDNG